MKTITITLLFLISSMFVWAQEKQVLKGRSKSKIVRVGNPNQQEENNEVVLQNEKKQKTKKLADVDRNIPENKNINPYRYALVIGNEDYKTYQAGMDSEINVDYAENDARIFAQYATNVLGVPAENMILLINAKTVEFHRVIEQMRLLLKNSAGKAELIFYYAGHGFPDEANRDPYILPVDVSPKDLNFAIKLDDLYSDFSEFPSKRVTVFLDACFTGGSRNKGFITGRLVKIKPKSNPLKGNMVVYTAVSETQSALSYNEMQHGMFTYFLLKKFQDSKGKATYSELADYLKENVGVKSVLINGKEQNPQINISNDAVGIWEEWKLNQ